MSVKSKPTQHVSNKHWDLCCHITPRFHFPTLPYTNWNWTCYYILRCLLKQRGKNKENKQFATFGATCSKGSTTPPKGCATQNPTSTPPTARSLLPLNLHPTEDKAIIFITLSYGSNTDWLFRKICINFTPRGMPFSPSTLSTMAALLLPWQHGQDCRRLPLLCHSVPYKDLQGR